MQQIMWIGSQSQMEPTLLQGYDLTYKAIPAAGLHGVGLLSVPGNLIQLVRGWRISSRLINQFKPHVILYTGGYIGVPLAMASKSIASVVFIPDVEPGFAHKFIQRKASFIAVSTPDSKGFIRAGAEISVTGYPVRKELLKWNYVSGRQYFGIPEGVPTILVFGGSKGARSINRALASILEKLLREMHVIHISGLDNWDEVQTSCQTLTGDLAQRYHAFPFMRDEMGAAFAAADLAVCRAGASTLGELPAFGLPAILVPYPHAWRYQARNAHFLAQRGGAVMLDDNAMRLSLLDKIFEIIRNPTRLNKMKSAMQHLFVPDAAVNIAGLLIQASAYAIQEEKENG